MLFRINELQHKNSNAPSNVMLPLSRNFIQHVSWRQHFGVTAQSQGFEHPSWNACEAGLQVPKLIQQISHSWSWHDSEILTIVLVSALLVPLILEIARMRHQEENFASSVVSLSWLGCHGCGQQQWTRGHNHCSFCP